MTPLIPFGYFGGKGAHLKHLLPELNTPHSRYGEPFAGSLAVLLNKPRVKHEYINDLSGDVFNFWVVLRDRPDELICALDCTPPGEAAFIEARDAPASDCPVERARRFVVLVSQGRNCLPYGTCSNVRARCYRRNRKTLRRVADAIRDIAIDNTCGIRATKRIINNVEVNYDNLLVYLDPPYVDEKRVGGQYLVDYKGEESEQFHNELLQFIIKNEGKAKFAISGYSSELYEDTLSNWHRATWEGAICKTRTEVLWRNYKTEGQMTLDI